MKNQQIRLLIVVIAVLTLGTSVAFSEGVHYIILENLDAVSHDFVLEKVNNKPYWDEDFNLVHADSLVGGTLTIDPGAGNKDGWVNVATIGNFDPNELKIGLGIYRLSLSQSNIFIYIDMTTADLNKDDIEFRYKDGEFSCWTHLDCKDDADPTIELHSTIKVWEETPSTEDRGAFEPTNPSGISVTASGGNPLITWTSSNPPYLNSTVGGSKHDIWRKASPGSYTKIKDNYISTSYTDTDVLTGFGATFYYKVRGRNSDDTMSSVNYSGEGSISGHFGAKIAIGEKDAQLIEELRISNYPNPFNPETSITFTLPEEAKVRLVILDILGRQVALLADGRYSAGVHTVIWNGINQASGLYYYTLAVGNEIAVGSMMLTK